MICCQNIINEYAGDDQSSFQEVRRAYLTLTGEYITQLGVMTRQIGGVRYNRAHPSQQIGGSAPTGIRSGSKEGDEGLSDLCIRPQCI